VRGGLGGLLRGMNVVFMLGAVDCPDCGLIRRFFQGGAMLNVRRVVVAAIAGCAAGVPGALGQASWIANGNNLYFTQGRVSIGTTNPAYPLYVIGSGPAVIVGATTTPNALAVGVQGQSASTVGRGVMGISSSATGQAYGGYFRSQSNQGIGIYGLALSLTGVTSGIRGQAASTQGIGLLGFATAATGNTTGILGQAFSTSGTGAYGLAGATSGETNGVYGEARSTDGAGVYGAAVANEGVNYGVYGETLSLVDGFGVYSVGDSAATGLKLFQIDHPHDPANRMLNHFSAEGPEPYLVYRGTAILESNGTAVVQLPSYFQSINRDPHYQLTPIGAPASLYIAQEVVNNQFVIAGGQGGMKVSWTVTGIRNDPYVQRYGAAIESIKPASQRGRFLHPELYGQPRERALRTRPVVEVPEIKDEPLPGSAGTGINH
jgi:hypothetical protein